MNKPRIRILCDNMWSFSFFKKIHYWPVYSIRDSSAVNYLIKNCKLKYHVL
jgi:hypothetical protein